MLICVLAYISDLFSTYDFLFPVDCYFFFSYLEKTFQSFLSDMFSVQFSHTIMSNSLQPHALQHARLPCPSPTPGACSNSCPLSWWCHPTISSSVIPFSSCLQSFPASWSFPMSQFFASGGQIIGVSDMVSIAVFFSFCLYEKFSPPVLNDNLLAESILGGIFFSFQDFWIYLATPLPAAISAEKSVDSLVGVLL